MKDPPKNSLQAYQFSRSKDLKNPIENLHTTLDLSNNNSVIPVLNFLKSMSNNMRNTMNPMSENLSRENNTHLKTEHIRKYSTAINSDIVRLTSETADANKFTTSISHNAREFFPQNYNSEPQFSSIISENIKDETLALRFSMLGHNLNDKIFNSLENNVNTSNQMLLLGGEKDTTKLTNQINSTPFEEDLFPKKSVFSLHNYNSQPASFSTKVEKRTQVTDPCFSLPIFNNIQEIPKSKLKLPVETQKKDEILKVDRLKNNWKSISVSIPMSASMSIDEENSSKSKAISFNSSNNRKNRQSYSPIDVLQPFLDIQHLNDQVYKVPKKMEVGIAKDMRKSTIVGSTKSTLKSHIKTRNNNNIYIKNNDFNDSLTQDSDNKSIENQSTINYPKIRYQIHGKPNNSPQSQFQYSQPQMKYISDKQNPKATISKISHNENLRNSFHHRQPQLQPHVQSQVQVQVQARPQSQLAFKQGNIYINNFTTMNNSQSTKYNQIHDIEVSQFKTMLSNPSNDLAAPSLSKNIKSPQNSNISRSTINRNINEDAIEGIKGIEVGINELKSSPYVNKSNEAFESLIDKLKKKLKTSIQLSPNKFNSPISREKSSRESDKIHSSVLSTLSIC